MTAEVFRISFDRPVEHALAAQLVDPGMRVLDVGTAATGRSALLLHGAGAEVHSIELVFAAVAEFGAKPHSGIHLTCGDMLALPYADGSFDGVIVAFHGLDYMTDPGARTQVLREFARVVRPGGFLTFDAFNRIGLVCNPGIFRSLAGTRMWIRHIATGRLWRPTFIDANGLEVHQATPRAIIRHVERSSPFRYVRASNLSGSSSALWLLTMLAAEPYYVFRLS